ncbi:MAG: MauE/DoxX family redox-associated membrane protein [Acidobacteriota bacterium]
MSKNWRFLTARLIETIIGLVFLIAGGLKAWEPLDFVRQIGDYQILTAPLLIKLVAWVMIVVEIALGTALIIGYRRRWAVPFAAILLCAFLGLLGWAWFTGSTADCGCFGSWVKRTPAEAFAEDLAMLMVTGLAWGLHRLETDSLAPWRAATVALSIFIGLSVTVYASNSPRQSDDPLQRLNASANQPRVLGGLVVQDLSLRVDEGRRVVALIDTGCEHCQASVPELNRLHRELQSRQIPLVVLCSNSSAEVVNFREKFKAEFPMGRISYNDFRQLFERGQPPRLLLVAEGGLLKIFDGVVPPTNEVEAIFN